MKENMLGLSSAKLSSSWGYLASCSLGVLTELSCLLRLRLVKTFMWRIGGGAGSSGNNADLKQPAKFELGLWRRLPKIEVSLIVAFSVVSLPHTEI
jgi:hypothetical protein